MTKIYIIILLVFSQLIALAQNPQLNPQGDKTTGKIQGSIKDEHNNEPILYATIALYSQKDSSLITGTMSGEGGNFNIPNVKFGRYFMEVKFIGYNKKVINEIKINPKEPDLYIGDIKLSQTTTSLEGVEITAERTYVEYKIDKKVVNVGKDLNSSGGTAVDALENVPSVTVDIDGNVALRGSSSFTVFINGKPTPLSGTDALQQIPVGAIKNIEIITNPSAKYDPDGLSGIINVILKEDTKLGLNGMIDLSVNNRGTYGINGIFSYNVGKFNLFIGGNYNNNKQPGAGLSELITQNGDTNIYRTTTLDRNRERKSQNIKAGFDYNPNEKNSISFEGSIGKSGHFKDFESKINEYNIPQTYNQYLLSYNPGTSDDKFYSFSINHEYKIDKKGSNLQTMFYYENEEGINEDISTEYLSDANWLKYDSLLNGIITRETETGPQYRFKMDLVKKLKDTKKFESGVQAVVRPQFHVYQYEEYQPDNGWTLLPNFGSELNFTQNVYSAYAIYSGEYKTTGYQFGLRGENTFRNVYDENKNYSFKINRFDLFPTVHFSKKIKGGNQMLLSYSRRIDRPGGWELEPFTRYISSNFKRRGNPELQPEFTNNFELSYQKSFDNSYFSIEGYYRSTNNKLTRIQEVDTDGIILMTFENMDKDISTGVEFMLNLRLIKWMDINISSNYYYYQLLAANSSIGEVNTSSNNFDIRGNISFIATKTTRFQINGFYGSPSVTPQGRSSVNYMISASLRQDLFKKKVTVSLRVNDIFNTMKHEFISYGDGFSNFNSFTGLNPTVTLNLTYKINNYKEKKNTNGMDMREGGDGIM
jgi:outer membrane receptor protein involved in Fe transport